ncbi:hypothetical protein J3458_003506 [Metarhizium acridum]|uniref:uncharacterized protein n=1 Tax=Metarhizium acridum TaxID=92637 RepID=UPI001C6C6D33|nr:hypothetical protein J3458_003506 [Metarhizium acridum]
MFTRQGATKTKTQVNPDEPQALVLAITAPATWGDAMMRERNTTYMLSTNQTENQVYSPQNNRLPGNEIQINQLQVHTSPSRQQTAADDAQEQQIARCACDEDEAEAHQRAIEDFKQEIKNLSAPQYPAEALVRIEQKIDRQDEAIIRQNEEMAQQGIQLEKNTRQHDVLCCNVMGLYDILRLSLGFEARYLSALPLEKKSDYSMDYEQEQVTIIEYECRDQREQRRY